MLPFQYIKLFNTKKGNTMIIDSHQHLMLPTGLQLQKMNEARIDKAILFCTSPHPEKANNLDELKQEMNNLYKVLNGANNGEGNMKRLIDNIEDLTAVIKKYPSYFMGFGSVPLGLSTENTSEWISNYIINSNLIGIGEFTPGTDEHMNQLQPVFEAISQFPKYPIWIHTFNPVSKTGIKTLMHLCTSFPSVPVIWGHLGGYHWMEVIDYAKSTPNAYLDLSAGFSSLVTKMAITELPDRCLFSSDAPYGEPLLCKQQIEFACPSDSIAQMVLGENIMKLLNL
jgi:predicted TIM-barrel fold metal-dependent hydrolase